MGLTDLLEHLTRVGPGLSTPGAQVSEAAEDRRNEVNAALLPVWQWLDGLKPLSDENDVDWVMLDGAPSEETVTAVKAVVSRMAAGATDADAGRLQAEIALLGSWLTTLADETEERLDELDVDAERRNRLLLPLRAHLSELAVNRGSSEALSLARQSLGQVGERQLSEGIAKKVEYEQKRANGFRAAAVVSFGISICWLIASYVAFDSGDIARADQISRIVSRLAIGSALLALAVYLSREGEGHRNRASAWQTVQLQMDTIDLYCASLPDSHKDAIRLSFGLEVFSGARLFSVLGGPAANGQEDSGPPPALQHAVALAKAVGSIR
jgi:hypothetical protein